MVKSKKQRVGKKLRFEHDSASGEDADKMIAEGKEASPEKDLKVSAEAAPEPQPSESVQGTVTSSESTKKRQGGVRGISSLHKVIAKKAQGKKYKIRYNEFGVPIGQNRSILQSYIGMAARNKIPIDIPSWPDVDSELKAKLWLDVKVCYY